MGGCCGKIKKKKAGKLAGKDRTLKPLGGKRPLKREKSLAASLQLPAPIHSPPSDPTQPSPKYDFSKKELGKNSLKPSGKIDDKTRGVTLHNSTPDAMTKIHDSAPHSKNHPPPVSLLPTFKQSDMIDDSQFVHPPAETGAAEAGAADPAPPSAPLKEASKDEPKEKEASIVAPPVPEKEDKEDKEKEEKEKEEKEKSEKPKEESFRMPGDDEPAKAPSAEKNKDVKPKAKPDTKPPIKSAPKPAKSKDPVSRKDQVSQIESRATPFKSKR